MAILAPLKALVITPTEQASGNPATDGGIDVIGTLSTVTNEISECITKLNALAAKLPGGANKTAIQAAATALA